MENKSHIPLEGAGKGPYPRRGNKESEKAYKSNSFWDNTSFAKKQKLKKVDR